jgi:hypothetical protein
MCGPGPKPLPVVDDQPEAAEFKPLRHPDHLDTYDKSVALHEHMERHEDLSGYDETGRIY